MKRTRPLLTCAAALATVCGLALPALAQTPPPAGAPPADMAAPPPPPPPMAAAPMDPMAAPRAADDMTGSVGFGVGVVQNVQLVGTTADVAIKYWMHDNLALVPQLNFALTNISDGGGTTWVVAPQVQVLFVPLKGASTRLELGGGIGFRVGKDAPMGPTFFDLNIPITAGVEHFFTRWFSVGIAVGEDFFLYQHPGGGLPNTTSFTIASGTGGLATVLAGSLFFYTD